MQSIRTIVICLLAFGIAGANIINVPTDHATIQGGIDAAVDGDTVLVAEGTFFESINYLGKAITVASHFILDQDTTHIANTIIDGSTAANQDSASVVYFQSGEDTTSVLMGLKITGGTGTKTGDSFGSEINGGGVFCMNSSASILHNIIRGNQAVGRRESGGGGIFAGFTTEPAQVLILKHNSIIENHAESQFDEAAGGGLWIDINSQVQNNTFARNTCEGKKASSGAAMAGGGYAQSNHKLSFCNNKIIENTCKTMVENGFANGAVITLFQKNIMSGNLFLGNKNEKISKNRAAGLNILYSDRETLVNNNIFRENISEGYSFSGAALSVNYSHNINVDMNLFEDNKCDAGAGIFYLQSSGIIRNNTLRKNRSLKYACGLETWHSNVLVENNIFTENLSPAAGSVWLIESNGIVQNNLVYNNQGGTSPGIGVHKLSSNSAAMVVHDEQESVALDGFFIQSVGDSIPDVDGMLVINNTVYNNRGKWGGGLYTSGWKTIAMNNIFYGNTATEDGNKQVYNTGGNLTVLHSLVQYGWAGDGNVDRAPLFADEKMRLAPDSPCLGAGISEMLIDSILVQAPLTDFSGAIRPQPADSNPDIGAWEHALGTPHFSGRINVPADYATIQGGINAAFDGDTVLVKKGTYYENINFKGKAITVASHFIVDNDTSHISKTIIDGSQAVNPDSASVVLFVSGEDSNSVLTGFTITGGAGTVWNSPYAGKLLYGGGVFCNKSGARISNNMIRDNIINADDVGVGGGGIAAEADGVIKLLIIEDNIIKNNRVESKNKTAESGGVGIFMNCRIVNNIIQENQAIGHEFSAAAALGVGQWDKMLIKDNNIISNKGVITGPNNYVYAVVMLFDCSVDFTGNLLQHNTNEGGKGPIGTVMYAYDVNGATIKGNRFLDNRSEFQRFLSKSLIIAKSTNVLIDSNIIVDNKNTGGIHLDQSNATVQRNTVTDNSAYYATGISGIKSKVVVQNNVVARNIGKTGSGGGWFMDMESALIQNNLIYENDSGSRAAGGIAIGTLSTNQMAQIAINKPPAHYAAVSKPQKRFSSKSSVIPDLGAVVLINNTIYKNSAQNYGGGIFVLDWETYSINNIIWGNTAGTDGTQIWDPGNSMKVYNCDIQGGWETAVKSFDDDPLFVNDANRPFQLSETSPCIDKGINEIEINGILVQSPKQDCYGFDRVCSLDDSTDVGAAEFDKTTVLVRTIELPATFNLSQNYPNPFNPSTTIEYSLPGPSHVYVAVYNLRGQRVSVLVDGEQNVGMHSIVWNATDAVGAQVSSGVYLYRLCVKEISTGEIINNQDQKMILLK
jgi:hypothetical protein